MRHTNTFCGQNAEFLNVKAVSAQSNHWLRDRLGICLPEVRKYFRIAGALAENETGYLQNKS